MNTNEYNPGVAHGPGGPNWQVHEVGRILAENEALKARVAELEARLRPRTDPRHLPHPSQAAADMEQEQAIKLRAWIGGADE